MNYFQEYLVDEFAEDYQEGRLSRRDALKLIASVTGSLLLANTILAGCAPAPESTTAADPTGAPQPTTPAQEAPTATSQPSPTTAAIGAAPTDQPATSTEQAPASTEPAASTEASPAPGTVSPDDPDIEGSDIEFPGEGATLFGYLARPAGEGSYPVILVCHENRGLTDHIKDVARRLAKAGYVALAVDLLSRQGGTASVGSENVPGALGNISAENPDQFVQDFRSGWQYLQGQPYARAERVGMVGFCFGGGVTWQAATNMPELLAAVPYYGPIPPLENVPNINAAVLAIYAERDQRINQGIPAIEEAMQQHNKIFEKVIYPNADHAFHNDTGTRYNAEAAQDAWRRTMEWFGRYVRQEA